jgi:hypothetical protein
MTASQAADEPASGSTLAKIVLVIITFLLTTVIGALWTSFLSTTSWRRQSKVDLFRKRYDEGTKLLEDLSLLIGTRFYLMQRFFWAIRDSESNKIAQREDDYFKAVADWNARFWLNRNKIRLLVSTGVS